MKNYITTINRFFVITIIYQRMNTNMSKIDANLVPPLDIWYGLERVICLTFRIRSDQIWQEFIRLIEKWETFKEKRSRIVVLSDIVKNTLGVKHLHQYTGRSVEKRVCRTFHLAFYLIQLSKGMEISARELVYWWVEEGVTRNNLCRWVGNRPCQRVLQLPPSTPSVRRA